MADPRDLGIYEAILAAFRSVDGAPTYTYELATAVAEGEFPPGNPPRASLPCVAVADPVTEQGDGPDLVGVLCRVTVRFQLWAPGATQDAAGRVRARVRLAADLRHALRTARGHGSSSALYGVHNFSVALTTADGRQLGLTLSCGYGEGEITCEYPLSYEEAE